MNGEQTSGSEVRRSISSLNISVSNIRSDKLKVQFQWKLISIRPHIHVHFTLPSLFLRCRAKLLNGNIFYSFLANFI